MKKITVKVLSILMAIAAFALISLAQDKTERVKFASGETDGSWTRDIAANGSHDFVFRVKKDQTISFTVGYDFRDSDIEAFLMEPNMQDSLLTTGPKSNNDFVAEKNGDYLVRVRNMSRKKLTMTFYLSIFDDDGMGDSDDSSEPDIPREEIEFGKADFAELKRTIPANSTQEFIFQGEEGLNANVKIATTAKSLEVMFCGDMIALNKDVSCLMDSGNEWAIEVSNPTNKPVSMTLTLSFDAGDEDTSDDAANEDDNMVSGERVKFAKGETSASVTKVIPANGSVDFIINAKKGQTMGFTVGYDFRDSDIEAFLTEPGMQDITISSGPKEPNEFIIKKTGDHRLTVNNTTKKKVTITLYLDIE